MREQNGKCPGCGSSMMSNHKGTGTALCGSIIRGGSANRSLTCHAIEADVLRRRYARLDEDTIESKEAKP